MTHGNCLGHNSFPFNRSENDILPFFTETHIFPWTSLSFWICFFRHEKWNGGNETFYFFAFLRFAKHLRIGNHLLLSCKQAKRTGQKRKTLASWSRRLAQICARLPPQGCGEPRETDCGTHFASMLVFYTTRHSCREQGWYSRLWNEIWASVRVTKLFW